MSKLASIGRRIPKIYLLSATFIGLIMAAGIGDRLLAWNYDTYDRWAVPLLWNVWLPASVLLFVIFLLARKWMLAISPGAFLLFFLLLAVVGPFLINFQTSLTGRSSDLEPFDYFLCLFGVFYSVLNICLLKRWVFSTDQIERLSK